MALQILYDYKFVFSMKLYNLISLSDLYNIAFSQNQKVLHPLWLVIVTRSGWE